MKIILGIVIFYFLVMMVGKNESNESIFAHYSVFILTVLLTIFVTFMLFTFEHPVF